MCYMENENGEQLPLTVTEYISEVYAFAS
jgi:hypothetical protein